MYVYVYVTMYRCLYRGRSGYVSNQYQHLVRVCVPFDEHKLGLVSPHRGLTKPNNARSIRLGILGNFFKLEIQGATRPSF